MDRSLVITLFSRFPKPLEKIFDHSRRRRIYPFKEDYFRFQLFVSNTLSISMDTHKHGKRNCQASLCLLA